MRFAWVTSSFCDEDPTLICGNNHVIGSHVNAVIDLILIHSDSFVYLSSRILTLVLEFRIFLSYAAKTPTQC